MNTHSKIKVSDIPPTTLRLPPELRDRLMREAAINRRSLSQEAAVRLEESFAPADAAQHAVTYPTAREPHAAFSSGPPLTDHHRLLLSLFNSLSTEKQLALLNLLKR
ncbi:MAG: Arc family DNA-binding protein [Burkholderiaceae bacterium]|nr:Arc family DNA-binding protein [Burkholderiaceae bacterium]